jgi:tight adherence protein B
MALILTLVLFLVIAAGIFALASAYDLRNEKARLMRARLAAVDHAATRGSSEELDLLRDELLSDIPVLNRVLARSAHMSRLQKFLMQAEVKMRAGKFLLISATCAVVVAMLIYLLTYSPLLAFLAMVGGAALPTMAVSFLRTRRFHKFEQLFPEAIDMLSRATRAGHAFPTALELIADECAQPLSGEFRQLYEQQKFGLPMRDALLNLADRVPIIDVKFFVTAVLLQRETGGNLAEILDNLSRIIRERFKILRQVRVFTAQGRLTLMLLMALPPGLVVVMLLLNPEFIKPLFTDSIGHLLLTVGIIMQTTGFFLIRKIIHIKV